MKGERNDRCVVPTSSVGTGKTDLETNGYFQVLFAISGGVISSIHCCISSPLVVLAAVLRDGEFVVGSIDLAGDGSK